MHIIYKLKMMCRKQRFNIDQKKIAMFLRAVIQCICKVMTDVYPGLGIPESKNKWQSK